MTVRDVIRRRLGAAAVLTLAAAGVAAADPPSVPPLELPPVSPAGGAVPAAPVVPAVPLPPTAPVVPPPTAPVLPPTAPAPVVPPPAAPDVKPVVPPPVVPEVKPAEPKAPEAKPAEPKAPDVKPVAPPAADAKPTGGLPPLALPSLSDKPKPSEPAKPVDVAPVVPAKPIEVAPMVPTKPIDVVPMNPVAPVKPADPVPPKVVKPVAPAKPVGTAPESPMSAPTPPAAPATPPATAPRPATRADGLPAFHLMIAEAKVAYSKVRDYSGHLIRQERVKGVLQPEQTAEVRAKAQPASVYLKWLAPAGMVGREAAFISGKHAGRVRVKPAGSYGLAAWSTVEPTDPKALADSRTPLPYTGVGPIVARLERLARVEAQLRNPVFVTVGEYTYAGKPVTRYEAVLEQPHALREAYRVVVYIDPDTKLPVRYETYDQPTPGGDPMGELLEACSFVNLKFNQGLPDSIFDK